MVNDYINNNFEYAKEAGAADNEKTEENNGGDNSDEDDDSEQDENQTGSSSDSESDSDSGNESDDSDASADSDDKYLAEQAKKALGEDVEGALSRRSLRSREVNVVSEESSAGKPILYTVCLAVAPDRHVWSCPQKIAVEIRTSKNQHS